MRILVLLPYSLGTKYQELHSYLVDVLGGSGKPYLTLSESLWEHQQIQFFRLYDPARNNATLNVEAVNSFSLRSPTLNPVNHSQDVWSCGKIRALWVGDILD